MIRNIFSLRKFLFGIGLLTVVTSPTTLIISSFNSEEIKEKEKEEEPPKHDTDSELIVKAINSTTYHYNIKTNSDVTINRDICAGFIKKQLPKNLEKIFKSDLLTLNKITKENGKEISSRDFKKPGTVYTKINYNYAEIEDQITNLIIKVVC